MILPISYYGDLVLKIRASEVDTFGLELKELISNMFETLETKSSGVGLAAPQVGHSIRLFVTKIGEYRRVFINPEILEYSEETCFITEGCISVPGIREEVERPKNIKVRYFDENEEEHIEEFTGLLARVIQHEYDHLEGKTFIDRLSNLRRTLLKSKLNNVLKSKR